MALEVRVCEDPAGETADRLVAAARAGGHIALTGGSTPRIAYERAAALEGDWSEATAWWGDERCVPPDDERSNYKLAYDALLSRLDRPPRSERIEGELGPHEAAARYERELVTAFGDGAPAFDLMLLGLGPDGHCGSLFPGKPEVDVVDRWVVGVEEAGLEPYVPRASLTVPGLTGAQETVFLVAGEEKADAVRLAFGPGGDDVPARRVAESSLNVTVLLDAAAAAELPGSGRPRPFRAA